MQTIICSLIVIAALLYVANRWLPARMKQRCRRWLGKTVELKPQAGGCGSCSSCGNCGSDSGKLLKK